MFVWDDRLRCSEAVKNKKDKIIKRVEGRKITSVTAWCIALPSNQNNLFDIYNMAELLFRHYRKSDLELHIVGLAESKDSAQELLAQIIEDIIAERGELDIKGYYQKNVEESN